MQKDLAQHPFAGKTRLSCASGWLGLPNPEIGAQEVAAGLLRVMGLQERALRQARITLVREIHPPNITLVYQKPLAGDRSFLVFGVRHVARWCSGKGLRRKAQRGQLLVISVQFLGRDKPGLRVLKVNQPIPVFLFGMDFALQ